MKTLHEMATKLQEFLVDQQMDAHNRANSRQFTRYNNLKIKMDPAETYPNITVTIGISSATFNLDTAVRTAGGLGQDEKYVNKWLRGYNTLTDLKELYLSVGAVEKGETTKPKAQEGESDDVKLSGQLDREKKKLEQLNQERQKIEQRENNEI